MGDDQFMLTRALPYAILIVVGVALLMPEPRRRVVRHTADLYRVSDQLLRQVFPQGLRR